MNFIAGLFPATVASLSFVNYGGKFRLEWMSTSERAECFYPSDSFLRQIAWRAGTHKAGASLQPMKHTNHLTSGCVRNQIMKLAAASDSHGTNSSHAAMLIWFPYLESGNHVPCFGAR